MTDKKPNPEVETQSSGISAFLGPELSGFHLAFVLMIISPLGTFFGSRLLLRKAGFTPNQQDTFALICSVIIVWGILIFYSCYYYASDFAAVFCKKKKLKEKKKKE